MHFPREHIIVIKIVSNRLTVLMRTASPPSGSIGRFGSPYDFDLSSDFRAAYQSSSDAFIIMMLGNRLALQSTPFNELPMRQLCEDARLSELPRYAFMMSLFQFCGPMKLKDLRQPSDFPLDLNSDSDIFLITCPGLDVLCEEAPDLRALVFSLAQLSRLTVFAMSERLTNGNV
jgi:hypothetical protein